MILSNIIIFSLSLVSALCAENDKNDDCLNGEITNRSVIYFGTGVPVDYCYNETTSKNGTDMSSVPGCPKSIDGFPWVIFESNTSLNAQSPRCYLTGTQGPCPDGQVLYAQRDSIFGVCSCACFLVDDRIHNRDKRAFQHCSSGDLLQVYDKSDKSVCYNVGEQGPCPPGTIISSVGALGWGCLSFCDSSELDIIAIARLQKRKCLPLHENGDPFNTDDPTAVSVGFGYSQIRPVGKMYTEESNLCGSYHVYSNILRKCIRKLTRPYLL